MTRKAGSLLHLSKITYEGKDTTAYSGSSLQSSIMAAKKVLKLAGLLGTHLHSCFEHASFFAKVIYILCPLKWFTIIITGVCTQVYMCGVFGILLCECECTHLCADVHTRERQVPYSTIFCLIFLRQGLTESGDRLAAIKA